MVSGRGKSSFMSLLKPYLPILDLENSLCNQVLIKCMNTVISGDISKHDAELRDQLTGLCKKIRDRDRIEFERRAKSEQRSYSRESEQAEGAEPPPVAKRRSMSAEASKSEQSEVDREKATPSPGATGGVKQKLKRTKKGKKLVKQRSVDSEEFDLDPSKIPEADKPVTIDHKEILKRTIKPKADKRARTSPSPSILKTSASPRNRSESAKKQVKFNGKDQHHHEQQSRSRSNSPPSSRERDERAERRPAPRIEINVSWLLTVLYEPQGGKVDKILSLEHFDRTLHQAKPAVKSGKESRVRASRRTTPAVVDARPKTTHLATSPIKPIGPGHKPVNHEDYIYVFECKRWLAVDQEDGQIERVLKPTALLSK